MNANLYDYEENNPPQIHVVKPVMHPNNRTSAIGHIGLDKGRDLTVATFPRTRSEHWFRGDSTNGLTGYGLSEVVINRLKASKARDLDRVLIIETDGDRVIEYDLAAFKDATLVAYSPDDNESVIGDEAMRVGSDYSDFQRVIPVDEARKVFDRSDVTIHQ